MITGILDWLYEYMLISGIISLAILMYVGFFYLRKKQTKTPRYKYVIAILIFIPFAFLWSSLFSGNYGYAHNPKELIVSGNSFCFLDSYTRRSRTSEYKDVRLYIVNPITGEKQFRTYVGHNCDILASQNGLLFYYSDKNYYLLDVATNKILKTFSKETIPTLYPQTAAGIGSINFENEEGARQTMLLNVTCKNGKSYFIDPFSEKIADTAFAVSTKKTNFNNEIGKITIRNKIDSTEEILEFIPQKNSVASQLSIYSDGLRTNDKDAKSFIYPEFISIFSSADVIVIKSSETTDETTFLLTGISTDMKQLWQINQEQLGSSTEKMGHCVKYKNSFIFNIDNTYYSIDAKTGTINWKSSL